jgi:hypothetical protein
MIGLWAAACGAGGVPPAPPAAAPAAVPAPPGLQPLPLPPGPTAPRAQLRAGFGGLVDTIEIDVLDRLPLRAAVLVAPDGTAAPASYINIADNPRLATGQWSLSHRWEDPVGAANALGAPALAGPRAEAALHARQQLLAVRSVAEIPLPDPVAYRRDWRDWRIRLTFGTPPGDVATLEIPAPEPPPR